MTLAVTSAPFQSVNMPALDLRRYLGFGLQEGVASSTAMAVAQRGAGANMSVDIATGESVVQGDSITNQGLYYAYNDATFNLTGFTAANATNPRVDRVALKVQDQFQGDAANALSFVILTGTATAGATLVNLTGAASVPANHLLLANVLIPATATSITTGNIDTSYLTIRPSATAGASLSTTSAFSGGPPGSPVDKQIWYATAVDANGTRWAFQYNAGSGAASKWEFIGGPPLSASVFNTETTASTTYTDLATVGPSLALVRAGDWQIMYGALANAQTATGNASMAYAMSGGTSTSASSPGAQVTGASALTASVASAEVRTGIAAATTVTAKYASLPPTAGTSAFQQRWLRAVPIRIS